MKYGKMATYLMKIRDLQREFTSFKMAKVPQNDNVQADTLAKLASVSPKNLSRTTNVQVLRQPSIQRWAEVKNIECEESWMDPLIKYLTEDKVLKDPL